MRKVSIFQFFNILVLGLLIGGCFPFGGTKEQIKVAISSEIHSLDPAKAFDESSLITIAQTYETLYEYHYLKRPLLPQPLLAADMPVVSQDGTEYRITIKSGIQYHDHPAFKGKPRYVIAKDFINQIKRLAYPSLKSTGKWLFQDKILGMDEFSKKAKSLNDLLTLKVKGLAAPDDQTLVIKLARPFPNMLNLLCMSFVVPIPAEVLVFEQNNLDRMTIGTGPYTLKEKISQRKFTLLKSKHFRQAFYPSSGDRYSHLNNFFRNSGKQIPFLNQIDIEVIENEQERWQAFLKEDIAWIEVPQNIIHDHVDVTGKLSKEMKSRDIQLQVYPSFSGRWLGFNMNDPVLGKNKNLRLAIAHAINFEKYISVVTHKIAQRANSIYFPGIFGYNPAHDFRFKHNPVKALEYLKQAGYPFGKGLPELIYTTRGNSEKSLREAEFIRSELKKVGIKVRIEVVTFTKLLKLAREGKLQFWTDGWILDYPDPENLLQLLLSKNIPGMNKTSYYNSNVDKLYMSYLAAPTPNERRKILTQIENIIELDVPWIMLYYNRSYLLSHKGLKNMRYSSFIRNYFKYLSASH